MHVKWGKWKHLHGYSLMSTRELSLRRKTQYETFEMSMTEWLLKDTVYYLHLPEIAVIITLESQTTSNYHFLL